MFPIRSKALLVGWWIVATTFSASAFTFNSAQRHTFLPSSSVRRQTTRRFATNNNNLASAEEYDWHQFDDLLQESSSNAQQQSSAKATTVRQNRRIALTDSQDTRATILASTAAFPGGENAFEGADDNNDDPYASALDSQMGKIEQYQEQKQTNTLEEKFKSMDLQDIIMTLFIPGVLAFVGGRWVFNRVNTRVSDNTDETLDRFSREMLFHDGDFQEMELCIKDYKSKLVILGPNRNAVMLKRFLEDYSKKKTASPQAIASLSHVFTMFKLTEEKAAKILVDLCREMGTEKISSAGKLLFLGSRILKTPQGAQALQPIKDLIMSTYREESVAESMIEVSQQAIAESSYRSAVLAAGKNQSSLTPGWEVLGLEEATATQIFQDEQKEGFVSDRETMYGGQTRKYDKKGRQIEDDGKLANPEEANEDEEEEEEDLQFTSNVYECGNCGFTLFIAEGRESKFYGAGFKCPECGAPKSDFKARVDSDE